MAGCERNLARAQSRTVASHVRTIFRTNRVTPRRLLVVPYFYPPFPGSGNRWPTMATYLRRAGHSVTVVATDAFGSLPNDEEQSVVRVADLRSARPLRRLLRRGNLTVVGAATLERPPPRLLTSLIVPDAHIVSWMPTSLHTVRRLLRQVPFDCLITSSPPDTTHVIGLLLGRSRPAWIADFRDGWAFEPLKECFPTA